MQPIRGDVHVAIEYGKEANLFTLREVVEWFKKVVAMTGRLGTPTEMEVRHIDKAWAVLIAEVAEREGVPSGFLG